LTVPQLSNGSDIVLDGDVFMILAASDCMRRVGPLLVR
jgi:hypothetical protein